jgi:hypothetical protein
MYAGHDGNVYKNTGSGWEKYDNGSGSWNSVNTQQAQQRAQSLNQQRSSGGWSTQNLNSEMQDLQRGAEQSDRFQQFQRSGGGWGGSRSGGGWGGFGGGGRSWGGRR